MTKRPSRQDRLPSLEISPKPDLSELPPREDLRHPTKVISHVPSSDASVSAQIVQRETRLESNGQLVDFAVILQVSRDGGRWEDLVRIDTSHRFVHVHHLDGAHDANVVPRECRRDIDLAWAWAKNYAWDQASREIM